MPTIEELQSALRAEQEKTATLSEHLKVVVAERDRWEECAREFSSKLAVARESATALVESLQ